MECCYCLEKQTTFIKCQDPECCSQENVICSSCCQTKFIEIEDWLTVSLQCEAKECERVLCRDCLNFCYECANLEVTEVFCSEHAPEYTELNCEDCGEWTICPKDHGPYQKENRDCRICHRTDPEM